MRQEIHKSYADVCVSHKMFALLQLTFFCIFQIFYESNSNVFSVLTKGIMCKIFQI